MDEHVSRLSKLFLQFPGIGERQARRFAYFILNQPESYVNALSATLKDARGAAHTCTRCLRIFEGQSGLCNICRDGLRDQNVIVVVEKSQDIDSFKKTDYHGLYFVLGGLIPIVQKNILDGTNAKRLVERVKTDTGLDEIILAFPITPNGDHTDQAIRELLAPVARPELHISSLGRGLSAGAELEYADAESLSASLKKRE